MPMNRASQADGTRDADAKVAWMHLRRCGSNL